MDLNDSPKSRGDACVDFMKKRVTPTMTVSEYVEVYKEMCDIYLSDDNLLLYQCGYWDEGEFSLILTRQYPNEDEEYYQNNMTLNFAETEENKELEECVWHDQLDVDFFDYVRDSAAFKYAETHPIKSVVIEIEET